MKRLLVFLFLFVGGLALLWELERRETRQVEGGSTPAIEFPERGTVVSGGAGVGLSGAFQGDIFDGDTGHLALRVVSQDSLTQDRVDRLEDVTIQLFDPKTEEARERGTIRAARAYLPRASEDGLELRYQGAVEMEDVAGTFEEIFEGTTVTVETPRATIDASDPEHVRLDGDERLLLESPEFQASGVGFHLDLIHPEEPGAGGPHGEEDVVELLREGLLRFRRPSRARPGEEPGPETTGHLRATGDGPLQIRREGAEGPNPIRFDVDRGGELELRGSEPSLLAGTRISVAGLADERTESVEPERVEADGAVRWTVGSNVFTAQHSTMEFEEGRTTVVLTGLPRAQLRVDLSEEGELVGAGDAGELVDVDVRCRDEMRIERGRGAWTYVVVGPATVETQGVTLRSNGDLVGGSVLGEKTLAFHGSGGVVIEGEGVDVEAAAFDLLMERVDDEPVARIAATQGARVAGPLSGGGSYTVVSPTSLVVQRRGEELRVSEGDDVELAVTAASGEEELFARCDRLEDLDLEARTFVAEGNVLYRRAEETARGRRVVSHGEDRFTLLGAAGEPAELLSPFGTARAERIDVTPGVVHATGYVRAEVTSLPEDVRAGSIEFDSYDLSGDEMVLSRSVERLEDETLERRFLLEATGDVASRLVSGEHTLRLDRAGRMRAERVDHVSGSGATARRLGSRTTLTAEDDVVAHVAIEPDPGTRDRIVSQLQLQCQALEVERTVAEEDSTEPELSVLAGGGVTFESTSELDFHGQGWQLRVAPDRRGQLVAREGERVRLYGKLPTHELPFELTADRADFSANRIEATEPVIHVASKVAADGAGEEGEGGGYEYEARGRRLIATPSSLELLKDVRLSGGEDESAWVMDAHHIVLEGAPGPAGQPAELSKINAVGGVTFRLGEDIVAHADALFGVRPTGVLRLSGSPTTIDTPTVRFEAESIDFDPVLRLPLSSKGARALPPRRPAGDGARSGPLQDPGDGQDEPLYQLDFDLSTFIDGDSIVVCWREPRLVYREAERPPTTATASWAVFWLDRDEYQQLSDRERLERNREKRAQLDQQNLGTMRIFFRFLEANGIVGLVREAYFEGPVDIRSGDQRIARADSAYFDLTSGHGWLSNATLRVTEQIVGEEEGSQDELSIRAKWLRHSSNGSLRARNALLTSCSLEEPHVTVQTSDLKLVPKSNSPDGGYEVSLSGNSIDLPGLPQIPLGSIAFDTDEDLKPQIPTLRFGNSARFGQLFGLNWSGSARGLGRWFDDLLGSEVEEEPSAPAEPGAEEPAPAEKKPKKRAYQARYDVDASYLGSRGGLLDIGFTVKQREERYYFDFLTGIALDDGEDKGYVRVPEDERESTRLWLRSHAWFESGKNRLQIAYSDQGDPGVQSEFFEKDFVRYEEYESYVQWKRIDGSRYTQATVKTRVDEFRADVEELPSATVFGGRSPLLRMGDLTLVHTGGLSAGYLRRRMPTSYDTDGDGIDDGPLLSPFQNQGVYDDAFDPTGNQEVVRADLVQELEVPLALGLGGLRLVPFVSARGTVWSEAADDEDDATRLVLEGGARLSTVLWRQAEGGAVDQVSPYVAYRGEIDSDFDGTPHVFDGTETAVFGDFVDVGARARFGMVEGRSRFDLDLRGTYASDRTDGRPDGWLPLETYARLSLAPGGHVFDVWYDGRWDSEESEFVYSLFSLGTRIDDDAGLQLSHTYGRDESLFKIFDAATISGFYRWTEKWEWEARQTFSFLAATRLGTGVILRRYGHDLIFEVETDVREGEGTSVGFSMRPRLGYRPNRIGYIRW